MCEKDNNKKGFFAKIIESLDKKLEEKAKNKNTSSCCGGSCEPNKDNESEKQC